VTYFLFPAAITTVAALLGLTGPLALVVPLVAVGVIGAFYGMGLLAFLEQRFFDTNRLNHNFMRNLVIACGLIAGIALGVFIVASTPAVAGLLSFAANVPVIGVALPYVMGAAATLLVTGLIGYALYRASGMQKEQMRHDILSSKKLPAYMKKALLDEDDDLEDENALDSGYVPPKPIEVLGSSQVVLAQTLKELISDAVQILGLPDPSEAEELDLKSLTPLQQAQNLLFAKQGDEKESNYGPMFAAFQQIKDLSIEVAWQKDLVRRCGQKGYKPADLNRDLLGFLAFAINNNYSKEACVFALLLAIKQDPISHSTDTFHEYAKLLDCIKKGNKAEAFAAIHRLNLDVPIPHVLAGLGKRKEEQKMESVDDDPHAASYGPHPVTGAADKSKKSGDAGAAPKLDKDLGASGGRRLSKGGGDDELIILK